MNSSIKGNTRRIKIKQAEAYRSTARACVMVFFALTAYFLLTFFPMSENAIDAFSRIVARDYNETLQYRYLSLIGCAVSIVVAIQSSLQAYRLECISQYKEFKT